MDFLTPWDCPNLAAVAANLPLKSPFLLSVADAFRLHALQAMGAKSSDATLGKLIVGEVQMKLGKNEWTCSGPRGTLTCSPDINRAIFECDGKLELYNLKSRALLGLGSVNIQDAGNRKLQSKDVQLTVGPMRPDE